MCRRSGRGAAGPPGARRSASSPPPATSCPKASWAPRAHHQPRGAVAPPAPRARSGDGSPTPGGHLADERRAGRGRAEHANLLGGRKAAARLHGRGSSRDARGLVQPPPRLGARGARPLPEDRQPPSLPARGVPALARRRGAPEPAQHRPGGEQIAVIERQLKGGARRFLVRVSYLDERGRRRHLPAETFASRPAAERRERQLRAKVEAGEHAAAGENVTVAELCERWLRDVVAPRRRPRTRQRYEELLRLHVLPFLRA